MAKKKFFKSKSNFTIRRLHQSGSYGNIYERDYTTITKSLSNPGGQTPYGNTPTFKLTIRTDNNRRKKYNYGNWIKNTSPCISGNTNVWTLECMPEPNKDDSRIKPKPDNTRLTDFVCYGSASELIRSSLIKIISNFPAEIYIRNQTLKEDGLLEYGDFYNDSELIKNKGIYENMFIVENPMHIDIIQSVVPENSIFSKLRYFCESQYDYNVINENGEVIINGQEIKNFNDNAPENIKKKIWVVESGEDKGCLRNGDLIATVTFKDFDGYEKIKIYCFFYENELRYISNKSGYRIRPNTNAVNNFFDNLNDFEKNLLNQYTDYTANFETFIEDDENGWYVKNQKYKWPVDSYGEWNLLISGLQYADYMDDLTKLADGYDKLYTDAIWRTMVHESISNMDLTKIITDDITEYNPSKLRKIFNVIGRQFDEIKKYADNIKNSNTVTYEQGKNIPDYFLIDKSELSGWDTKEILNEIPNNIVTEPMYGALTVGFTAADANNEFIRRLQLNSKNIFSSKGTKRCIEDLMAIFGYHSTDWLRKYYSELKDKDLRKAFVIDEYIYVANNYNKNPYQTFAEKVKSANSLKDNFIIDSVEDPNFIVDDYQGLPVVEVNYGNETRIVPWFDKNKKYDSEIYFQSKGGWARNEGDENETNYIYDYTISNIYFVYTKDDLYNILPYQVDDLGVYYVNDIKTYFKRVLKYDSFETDGWEEINDEELLRVENIVDYNKGNNPHTGNYDGGENYKEAFKYLFKHSSFNNANSDNIENINSYGFGLKMINDTTKCQFFSENSTSEKRMMSLRVRNEVKPFNFFDFKDSTKDGKALYDEVSSLSIINSKELHITFDNSQKEFIENEIIHYLKQVIPSTTIFSYSFRHLTGDDYTSKAKTDGIVCNGNSCSIGGIVINEDK